MLTATSLSVLWIRWNWRALVAIGLRAVLAWMLKDTRGPVRNCWTRWTIVCALVVMESEIWEKCFKMSVADMLSAFVTGVVSGSGMRSRVALFVLMAGLLSWGLIDLARRFGMLSRVRRVDLRDARWVRVRKWRYGLLFGLEEVVM
jgi:hypothetical protein